MDNLDYEKQIFLAQIKDKIEFCKTKNKIEYTDFLDLSQKSLVLNFLKKEKFNNFIINDDEKEFDRNIFIFYPEKLEKDIAKKYFNQIVEVIKIKNPKELKYEHRVYLSGIMKLGIKREKFGDILVFEDEAYIIALKELSNYLYSELKGLKRFQKSLITIEEVEKLPSKENEFEDISIIVPSLRMDNIVSDLAKCSRNQAKELIEEGKVFINGIQEFKISKLINTNDIITIRGKGKFIFDNVENKTKKDNFVLKLKKFK